MNRKCAEQNSNQSIKAPPTSSPAAFLSAASQVAFSLANQLPPQAASAASMQIPNSSLHLTNTPGGPNQPFSGANQLNQQSHQLQQQQQLAPFARTGQQQAAACWPTFSPLPVPIGSRANLLEAQHALPFPAMTGSVGPMASKALQEAYFQQQQQPNPHLVNQLMLATNSPLLGARQQNEPAPSSADNQSSGDPIQQQQQQQKLKCRSVFPASAHDEAKLSYNLSTVGAISFDSGKNEASAGRNQRGPSAPTSARIILDSGLNGSDEFSQHNTERLYCGSNNNSTTSNNGDDDDDDEDDDDDDDQTGGRRRVRKTKIPKTVSFY